MEQEIEGAVVDGCHASGRCSIVDGVGAFVETDEIEKLSMGVDTRDPELIVVIISSAAEEQRLIFIVPIIGITVISVDGVFKFVNLTSPNGVFLNIVESGVEGHKREDTTVTGADAEQRLVILIPHLPQSEIHEIIQWVGIFLNQITTAY